LFRRFARSLRDFWIYFRTGHRGYLVYTMSIMNFVVLQHRLLISYVPALSQYLSRLSTFFLVFIFTYVPLAVVLGYFEFHKGELRRRPMLNPYTQDTLEATIRMNTGMLQYINGDAEGARAQIEENLAILRRWKKS
jgi:hypothetical protein